jgi:5-methylcytosine-specific restriction endonuclease McrA
MQLVHPCLARSVSRRLLAVASVVVALVAVDLAAPSVASAEAGVRNPRQNARQVRQDRRIRHGVRTGQLTREETRDLVRQRNEIRQDERAYKSDGSYTAAERAEVRQDLNQLSRDIYREKHDAETRPAAK